MIDQDHFIEVGNDAPKFERSKPVFNADDEGISRMTDNEMMICASVAGGYAFKENKWGTFQLDQLSNMNLGREAFDGLLLEQQYKQHILSLVQVHEDKRLKFDDFIKGKGKGVVFLLHGEPGTGKTLTAGESSLYYAEFI